MWKKLNVGLFAMLANQSLAYDLNEDFSPIQIGSPAISVIQHCDAPDPIYTGFANIYGWLDLQCKDEEEPFQFYIDGISGPVC